MVGTVVAVHESNANWNFDSRPTLETNARNYAARVCPNRMLKNTEENAVIRNIESYDPDYAGDVRGGLLSPTFFPTELEICDVNMASLCATEPSLTYPLDSEDDDYYDNEILPFYETIRPMTDSERAETVELTQPGQDKGQAGDSNSAQETDRLRNQLKEAYYLLINAMNDINMDVQQIGGGLTEQQATSSCSSHSRDSLCSRLSLKNRDSDSWSSGEDQSPQQVSDTDSLLLCLTGIVEVGVKGRLKSKSMANLSFTKKPTLSRSTSDGEIRYQDAFSESVQACETQSAEICDDQEAERGEGGTEAGELSEPRVFCSAVSNEELLQDDGVEEERGGQLNESSGSINSITSSSDSNTETATHQGHNNKQELTELQTQVANTVNKGHGVTVNKMQEWMHKGRMLSSEMKQRIEGSSLPRGGGQSQDRSCPQVNPGGCKPGAQTSSRAGKSVKAKSQQHQQQQPDCLDLPNATSFSPPSSPNPAKKSSSINWSFPDKIKSPRTVRKISMKMKKLPELSRKLSVKGTQNNSSSNGSSQLEPRAHSPKANGSGSEVVLQTSGPPRLASSGGGQASRNVISRYHLDSSVSTQHSFYKKKSSGSSKSASKGGYLSDGDSPELVAKSGKHGSGEGKGGKGKDTEGGGGNSRINGTELDIDAFRHYSFSEQPKCSQYISGLMSLHFYGAEDLKPPRIDSRDVYCAIQVDSVNKARTALLTCRTTFLDMDHTFNIELENAQHLKLVVFSWEPTPRRHRVCCHGTVVLPALFRVTRSHQLAVKLEPRGVIYVKLSLMEQWQNSLNGGPDGDREPQVFGVEVWRVVERENTGLMVPLLISKCINEIEKRGCQVVGLYRLCGSAAVKKELREAFERDSHAVELCENTYPDINVITGVLKDYLRELPYPLINKQLYEAVLESMAARPLRMGASGCENDQTDSEHTVSLLENLPEVERMMLRKLLDHLKLVASYQEMNKMTCQNLAVCFGPVLLSQRQEASCHTNRVFIDSEELASALHFKKHIEVLHYLLQLWPVVDPHGQSSSQPPAPSLVPTSSDLLSALPLRRRKERPQVLNLTGAEMAGVLRPKPGRLDSPSNRYAGDWSGCGETYFPSEMLLPSSKEEADYDDVPSEDIEATEEVQEKREEARDGIQLKVDCPVSDTADEEQPQRREVGKEEETQEAVEEQEKLIESDSSNSGHPLEEEEQEHKVCNHILPPRLPKEHTYQAYMKIQDISPVLSNRVNLRDLQESIDTLIGNLERELNKNKLNVGY
uniref:Synapse defective Rho GTPase homolog 2 n=1 Tax=Oreochromis niloticus TaxID=8128 RepID=I3JQM5_ORENI